MNAKTASEIRASIALMLKLQGLSFEQVKLILRLRSKEHARQHVAKGRRVLAQKFKEMSV